MVEQVRADDVDAVQKVLTVIADQRDPSKLDRQTLLRDIDELTERARQVARPNVIHELDLLRRDIIGNPPAAV